MHLDGLLATSALAASAVLLVTAPSRLLPLIATAAAATTVAIQMGVLRPHLFGFPLLPVLAAALAVPALVTWLRSTSKTSVSAGAIATFVGALHLGLWLVMHR